MPDQINVKKISLKHYKIIQTLGIGSFGIVKLIQHKKNQKFYALKILKKEDIIKLKQIDHVKSEILILNKIQNNLFIKFYGLDQDSRYLYIIFEYVHGGELFTYLRTLSNFKENTARFYAGQVITMFEILHKDNIIYRDLKPENLLIDINGNLKLTDFGFAKIVEKRTYTLCGTPEYLAPEILLQKGHGKPVDWWCLGIFIYEMLTGIDPFSDDDPLSIYQNILKGTVKFYCNFPKDAKSLVKHLLVQNLANRYGNLKRGILDIQKHRWFKNFDWQKCKDLNLKAPYIPNIKHEGDYSHYKEYQQYSLQPKQIKPINDPFLLWSQFIFSNQIINL